MGFGCCGMRSGAVLCFLVLALVAEVFTKSHICHKSETINKNVTEKCSEFMRLTRDGYTLDKQASNLTDMTDNDLEKKLNQWSLNATSSPTCAFVIKTETNVTSCCGGWIGTDCDTPVCKPACLNEGSCLEPGSCTCMPNYVGLACEDNTLEVTEHMKYCYLRTSCFGDKPEKAYGVMTKEECCDRLNGHGWGLAANHCMPCFKFEKDYLEPSKFTPDQPNVVPSHRYLSYSTCMGFGPNYWRTFDGLEFLFPGRCSYLLLNDGYHRVTVQMINCHSYVHCTKKFTITFGADDEIIVQGSDISVSGVKVVVRLNQAFISLTKGIKIEKMGDYFWLEHGTLRLRWDSKNTFFLTIEQSEALFNVSTSVGLCGNNNANPFDDMKTPSHESVSDPTKLGNSWMVEDPEVPCPESPPVSYSCLNTEDEAEAIDACGVLWLHPFNLCHDVVLVNHYFIRCVNDHCSAKMGGMGDHKTELDEEIEAALCQTLTAYGQICSSLNVTFEWRTKDLCPLKCPQGMLYSECWPRCIKTCASIYSPRSADCHDKRCYPGCSCPPGWFLTENKCVPAEECPCAYQGKLYEAASTIDIGCNQCKCKQGRWNCTDRPCSKLCSVIGFQHITTFDGKDYEFHGPECWYTLVELRNDEYWGAAIVSRGDLSISYSQIKCLTRTDISCINSVRITYRRRGSSYDVIMERNRVISVNGFILSDPVSQAYVTDDIYVKQVTSLVAVVQGFGFKVLYDSNGKLYVRLDPFFSAKVRGLCGNMDGSITNDFSSRSNIIEQLLPFVKSFSDCSLTWPEETTLEPIDACVKRTTDIDPKIPPTSNNRCKEIGKPKGVFEECLKVLNWKLYEDYCTRDVCASPGNPAAFCNIVSGLAYNCLIVGIKVDWMKDKEFESTCKGVTGYGCTPRSPQGYSDCTSKVTRCRDMQFSNPIPDYDYCIPGCNCLDSKLLNDRGECVRLADCTCYDRYTDKTCKAGEKSLQFQSECVCKNGDWQCKNGTIDIRCPLNQVYQRNMTNCGSTCSTYDFRHQCPKDTPTIDGCGCPPNTAMLPNGTCVDPDECPCAFDGLLYAPNEKVSVGCVDYLCTKRQWKVSSERNCKKRCLIFGDPHYITFDKFQYSFQGICEYTLVKYEKLFQVTAGNIPCGTTGVTCTKVIKAKVNGTEVHLLGGMNTTINGVQVKQAPQVKFKGGMLVHTDLFTMLFFDLGLDIYWDRGTSIAVALSTAFSGQVGGLCGNFDGIYGNELVDVTTGQPSGTIAEFTSRWKTVENCPDTDVPPNFDPCVSNPARKDWALKSCAIIREGELFAKCRKLVDTTEDFYKMCLFDSCGCDEGGDCKCFCTIVAAFAKECALKGECVRWRSHDLCPDMCEDGKVYQECAEPCKKTCTNYALKPEPCCTQADLVEGCFCPKDYVEDDNGLCVPVSECSCAYKKGPGSAVQMFPAGTTMNINCQKCTCFNGTFVCEGKLCPPCEVDQFTCASVGKCIQNYEVCDGIYDCLDKSDEYPLNPNCGPPTCSPKQFTCASGKMCVPQWSICDGNHDCDDGSDEHNCEPICEPGFFRCENYRCIPPAFVCDGKYDCGPYDSSDEKHCNTTIAPCLYVDYYRCVNDKCIPRHMTCDGHDDCGDESDELDCYDCVGKLQVVDKLSPELKVEPAELRTIFQNPNHTVPVKVTQSTVITIQLLVPNSYMVSFHMWVDYIREIQLVFLDDKGKPIKNGTHTWISKVKQGADIAVMQFNKERTSNIVKVSLKPFPAFTKKMQIKAITVRACYQLVPSVCPIGYKSVEYQYAGYGSKEFTTTINDILDGSDILEGSTKNVIVSINDFVAISRSIPSESFYLMSIRLFATNVSTFVLTVFDVNNNSQSEGVYPSTAEIVYYPGIGRETDLLRLTLVFKSTNTEIQVGKLLMMTCIKEDILCDRPNLIDYTSRRTARVYVLNLDSYQFNDAWNSMSHNPEERWNMTVERDQSYQYIMEFDSYCVGSEQVRWLTFTVEGISEFQVVIGHDVVAIERNIGQTPFTYESRGSIIGNSVTVIFTARDEVIHIYDAEVGICCWKDDHTTFPPTTELLMTKLPPATTISQEITGTPTPIPTVTEKQGCEMDIEFNYHRANGLMVSVLNKTGHPLPNPRNLLKFSPPPGRWSSPSKPNDKFTIRLNITERCVGFWEISYVTISVQNVRKVEMIFGKQLEVWEFVKAMQKNTIVKRMARVSEALDILIYGSGDMIYISDLQLEARCCSNETVTTVKTVTEFSTSTLETTLYSETGPTTESISHSTTEATTYEHLTTTGLPCPCETIPLDYGDNLRFDISIKDEAGVVLPGPRQTLLGSPDGSWSKRTTPGSKYYVNLTIVEPCTSAWKIAKIHITVKGALKVQVFAGEKELRSWDKLVPTSEIRLVETPCVSSNELHFIVEASGGNLQISNLFLDLCICKTETEMETTETTTSVTSTTTAFKTESTTPCDKSLVIDYYTYHTSFNMTTESDEGTIYPSALQALRYSEDKAWKKMVREDDLFIMNFTLPDICSNNWEISTINFRTQFSKEIQLKVDTTEIYKWTFEDYSEINEVSTVVKKIVHGNLFQLIFKTALGRLLIADLYIELFCNCTLETSTLTIPTTHFMPGTRQSPGNLVNSSTTVHESTTTCDKSLLIDYTTYHKSFNMTTESDEGTIYPSALQALRNSEDSGWRTMAREDQLFIMSFTLPDICSKNWEISTVNFKTQFAKVVQLRVDTTEIYKWTFEDYSEINEVTTVVRKNLLGNVFHLVFTTALGRLLVANLYIDIFCNCTLETSLPITSTTYKTESERLSTSHIKTETTTTYMTTETQPHPCLPTHYINNDTFTKLNVSVVLVNAFGENVGDASPALSHERWLVPYLTDSTVSLELKIWDTCFNPRISWLKFTVEGVFTLSLMIDNETIIDKRRIPNGELTLVEEKGTFNGSHIVLIFDLHDQAYFVYGLEVALCCEYCPNAFLIDYYHSSLNFASDLTDETGSVLMDARNALLYGPGLVVTKEIGELFSLVVKLLEPCPTTWYFRHYQFGLDWAAKFKVRIGSKTIETSEDFVLAEKYFTEKEGHFPGSDFELAVNLYENPLNPIFIYDLKFVACCVDLTTGTTHEVTTGTVEWTTKTGQHTTAPLTSLHTAGTVPHKTPKLTSLLTTETTTLPTNTEETTTHTLPITQTTPPLPTTDAGNLLRACQPKPVSMRNLLLHWGVNCLLIEDFNVTTCEGVCANRVVSTLDFDYRRITTPSTCSCCDGDGEVKTVIVKCNDVRKTKTYIGEHSLTYMEYSHCRCATCGLLPMDGPSR